MERELCRNFNESLSEESKMFVERYQPLYDKIQEENPRWLTISPPADCKTPDKFLELWYEEFSKFRKFATRVLGVVEFANLRMHFHICYSVKDRIKEYRVINDWRQSNMVKVYNGAPKHGIGYLFKDVEETQVLITNMYYIITMKHIEDRMKTKIVKSCVIDDL